MARLGQLAAEIGDVGFERHVVLLDWRMKIAADPQRKPLFAERPVSLSTRLQKGGPMPRPALLLIMVFWIGAGQGGPATAAPEAQPPSGPLRRMTDAEFRQSLLGASIASRSPEYVLS